MGTQTFVNFDDKPTCARVVAAKLEPFTADCNDNYFLFLIVGTFMKKKKDWYGFQIKATSKRVWLSIMVWIINEMILKCIYRKKSLKSGPKHLTTNKQN